MPQKLLILDFGAPNTQLIARSVRSLNVYCEIYPGTKPFDFTDDIQGIILSDSPMSVNNEKAPHPDVRQWADSVPVLGIGFGAQLIAKQNGAVIKERQDNRSGLVSLNVIQSDALFEGHESEFKVMAGSGEIVEKLPVSCSLLAQAEKLNVAAFSASGYAQPVYGLQFHPETPDNTAGAQIMKNFVMGVCKCSVNFTPEHFITDMVARIKNQVGDGEVVMALSGGVDSSVAATLIHKAIGDKLHCVFVDHGLLRKNEFTDVLKMYQKTGLNVNGIDARSRYYTALAGVTDPEQKRKIIGGLFIDIFQEEALKIKNVSFLGQGTIYPDVIESIPIYGEKVVVKSHHNVGGLPEKMNLSLVEPLRYLFKDEVRKIGVALGLEHSAVYRHPFPGPGLGVRLLGAITPEKVAVLQEADYIFIKHLRESGYYDKVWQAGVILLPVQNVGVKNHQRTYENAVALRAVLSIDAMTADWAYLPHDLLAKISDEIINNVEGVNRVVYDISRKPPATIEWE